MALNKKCMMLYRLVMLIDDYKNKEKAYNDHLLWQPPRDGKDDYFNSVEYKLWEKERDELRTLLEIAGSEIV
jgi:hypothetical protein